MSGDNGVAPHMKKQTLADPDQITVYYNPANTTHEKTVAHAQGTDKAVLAIPFDDMPTAHNIWTQIWDGLGTGNRDIFDPAADKYDELIAGREFVYNDWHSIVAHNTDMIRNPIAVSGTKAIAVERPGEIYRLQELGPKATSEPVESPAMPASTDPRDQADGLGVMLDR